MATKMEPPTLDGLVKEVCIPLTALDQKCSDECLKNISLFLDWRRVAPQLGLSAMDIEEIESKTTTLEKGLKTLQMWKLKFAYLANFKTLVQVLLLVGNAEHAERVCRLLLPQAHTGDSSGSVTAAVSAAPSDQQLSSPVTTAERIKQLPSTSTTPSDQPQSSPAITATDSTRQLCSTMAEASNITSKSHIKGIEKEIEELEDQFSDVVNKAEDRLTGSLLKVKRCITQLPVSIRYQHIKFLEEKRSVIHNANSISEIFSVLGLYWDFLNCGLLKKIIDKCGDRETKQLMDDYIEKLRDFRQRTKLRDFIDKWMGGYNFPHCETFITEMGDNWKERTLEDLENFRILLSRRLSFAEYAMSFQKVVPGSLIVFWALHHSFPLTATLLQDARPLIQEYNIQRVLAKGKCILDLRPPEVFASDAYEITAAGTSSPMTTQTYRRHRKERIERLTEQWGCPVDVGHIVAEANGGADDSRNYVLLPSHVNRRIGSRRDDLMFALVGPRRTAEAVMVSQQRGGCTLTVAEAQRRGRKAKQELLHVENWGINSGDTTDSGDTPGDTTDSGDTPDDTTDSGDTPGDTTDSGYDSGGEVYHDLPTIEKFIKVWNERYN